MLDLCQELFLSRWSTWYREYRPSCWVIHGCMAAIHQVMLLGRSEWCDAQRHNYFVRVGESMQDFMTQTDLYQVM